jgi:hypothetical protein
MMAQDFSSQISVCSSRFSSFTSFTIKGGPVKEQLYKMTSQYSKFEFSLPKIES